MATSKEQALLLDRLAAVLGTLNQNVKCSTLFVPELPNKGLPIVYADESPSFLEAEDQFPHGSWKVFIGPAQHVYVKEKTDLAFMLAISQVAGEGPYKLAMIDCASRSSFPPRVVRSYSGLAPVIEEAGIEVLEDASGLIVLDKPEGSFGFGSFSWERASKQAFYVTVSEKAVSLFEPGKLASNAGTLADDIIQTYLRPWRYRLKAIPDMADAVSLGKITYKNTLPFATGRSFQLENRCLPPVGFPERKKLDDAEKIVALSRVWDCYLAGFGLKTDVPARQEVLEELASDEMIEIVENIISGKIDTHDKKQVAALCDKASKFSGVKHDMSLDLFEPDSAKLSWPAQTRTSSAGFAFSDLLEDAPDNPAARAIDDFLADLDRETAKASEEKGAHCPVKMLMSFLGEGWAHRIEKLTSMPIMQDNPSFGLVLVQDDIPEAWIALSAAACVHAAGWDADDGVDALISIVAEFDELDEGFLTDALEKVRTEGVFVVADWKLGIGKRHLEDIAELADGITAPAVRSREETRFVLKDRQAAKPEMVEKVKEAGEQVLLTETAKRLSQMAGNNLAQVVAGTAALSGGKVSLVLDEIATPVYHKKEEEHWLLEVMKPAKDFFSRDDMCGLDRACDVYGIWLSVLSEYGLALSQMFPIGADADNFARIAEMIGIDSYLEAYFAGVPAEDIVEMPWTKKKR